MADRQLLGQTHPAVEVQSVLSDKTARAPDRRRRGRHRPRSVDRLFLDVMHSEVNGGSRLLEFHGEAPESGSTKNAQRRASWREGWDAAGVPWYSVLISGSASRSWGAIPVAVSTKSQSTATHVVQTNLSVAQTSHRDSPGV